MTHLKSFGRAKQCPSATQSQTVLKHKCTLHKPTSESVRRPLLRTRELEPPLCITATLPSKRPQQGEKNPPELSGGELKVSSSTVRRHLSKKSFTNFALTSPFIPDGDQSSSLSILSTKISFVELRVTTQIET